MVMTKHDVLTLLQKHQTKISEFGVKRLGLFGSFKSDTPDQESDVDFIVEFEEGKLTFLNFSHLAFFLEEVLGRPVELITPDSLSPFIGPRILREVEYVF